MKHFIKGLLFVTAFFIVPIFTLDEMLTIRNVFWFLLLFGACALLMWRFDMFDLPNEYRSEKEDE